MYDHLLFHHFTNIRAQRYCNLQKDSVSSGAGRATEVLLPSRRSLATPLTCIRASPRRLTSRGRSMLNQAIISSFPRELLGAPKACTLESETCDEKRSSLSSESRYRYPLFVVNRAQVFVPNTEVPALGERSGAGASRAGSPSGSFSGPWATNLSDACFSCIRTDLATQASF